MAARPPGGYNGQHVSRDEDLIGLGDQPVYYGGNRPPVTDEEMLHRYDIDDSEQPRASTSYDDFVGSRPPHSTMPGAAGASAGFEAPRAPYMAAGTGHNFSQSSDLNNYQRYADIDDPHDDGAGFYHTGGAGDDTPGFDMMDESRIQGHNTGNGVMGRAKAMLGLGPKYSEMDLPLTEHGRQNMNAESPQERKKDSGFKFGFGRGKADPSTLGPRLIHLNNPPANSSKKWADNHVSTTKFNFATFFPKFLYEQFSKYANLFFLFTACLQQIPNISPTNRYTTIGPLALVLLVSAIKELVEDYKRQQSDRSLNNSEAQVLKGNSFETTTWVNVHVGDIIRVRSEEPFPADVVLLASSEPEGLCYIETANLDGETNLKIKQAIPETANLVNPSELSRLTGRIRSEQPNSSLYTYEATLTMQAGGGEKELPLNPEQLLLRGATLRNTPWIHGVVVFTGHESKLMRNATATPIKRTDVERRLNHQILMLICILLVLSIASAIGDLVVSRGDRSTWQYLFLNDNNPVLQFFMDLGTFWVLFSNLVPISLFVTVEMVKYAQAMLISSDLDMYYEPTDTPAVCRTSSLVEELGQIDYIFSDKTGTLTCNMMEFRSCSIGGIQYADDIPEDKRSSGADDDGVHEFNKLRENVKTHHSREIINQFLTLLSVCHTVIPERQDDKAGQIKYQASSPDEGALVEGAVLLGYKFIARKPRAVKILVDGMEQEYELLAVCEFNSTRKRMSTIFRCPDGKVRIYCKGADTVIMERLNRDNPTVEATLQHLEDYATEGLRTLCLAMREIPEDEFQRWMQIFEQASTTVSGNRADELDKAAELIERDFYLLGATAIEDRLQDGVPDTIHTLQTAGIKIWVLTGDRQETAINIGMSCKLISEDMTLLMINEDNAASTRDNIRKKLNAVRSQATSGEQLDTLALIIDGKSLTFALEKDLEKDFLDLAVMSKAVICCRVSPLQKALVVKLVKRHLKALLLAIGDGANDVSMIQAAHVGVGISGLEGLQAARSADIAIGQFRFLRKLLLVHGAWSYQRISKVILYSFYKNITLYMTQFWVCLPLRANRQMLTFASMSFRTFSRVKSSSSRGRCLSTTSSSPPHHHSRWESLTSSSRRDCSIGILSSTSSDRRIPSSKCTHSPCGFSTDSTTRSFSTSPPRASFNGTYSFGTALSAAIGSGERRYILLDWLRLSARQH
jgi:phospholipid-transporting ATPase